MKLLMPKNVLVLTESYLSVFRCVDMLFMHTDTGTESVSSFTNVEFIASWTGYYIDDIPRITWHIAVHSKRTAVEIKTSSLRKAITDTASRVIIFLF